jgi:hypothetical protein
MTIMSTTVSEHQHRAGSKRFVPPDRLPEFKLTPRVLALLGYTAKHRLISSDDLARLAGGSEQNVKRELRTLWANRYLLRPSVQLNTVAITGPQPLVYVGGSLARRMPHRDKLKNGLEHAPVKRHTLATRTAPSH